MNAPREGSCLVLGGAPCLWDDLETLSGYAGHIMAVNDVGLWFPAKVDHWFSLHPENFPAYKALRKRDGPDQTHTLDCCPRHWLADTAWHLEENPQGAGGSGLNAILVCVKLGYTPILVAGMPMDNSGHFNEGPPGHWLESRTPKRRWSDYGDRKHYDPWQRARKNHEIRFLSGRFA